MRRSDVVHIFRSIRQNIPIVCRILPFETLCLRISTGCGEGHGDEVRSDHNRGIIGIASGSMYLLHVRLACKLMLDSITHRQHRNFLPLAVERWRRYHRRGEAVRIFGRCAFFSPFLICFFIFRSLSHLNLPEDKNDASLIVWIRRRLHKFSTPSHVYGNSLWHL